MAKEAAASERPETVIALHIANQHMQSPTKRAGEGDSTLSGNAFTQHGLTSFRIPGTHIDRSARRELARCDLCEAVLLGHHEIMTSLRMAGGMKLQDVGQPLEPLWLKDVRVAKAGPFLDAHLTLRQISIYESCSPTLAPRSERTHPVHHKHG